MKIEIEGVEIASEIELGYNYFILLALCWAFY
jgi:hypothetical protein